MANSVNQSNSNQKNDGAQAGEGNNIKGYMTKDRFVKSRLLGDIMMITALAIFVYSLSVHFDILERIIIFAHRHESYELDEALIVLAFWSFCITAYFIIRSGQLKKSQEKLRKANKYLTEALMENTELRGIIPICASCKKVRDDHGYWEQVETYVKNHSQATFSHGICPECIKKLYPEFDIKQEDIDKIRNHPAYFTIPNKPQ